MTIVLVLNNAHKLQDATFYWIPKQDYSVDGSVVHPRGSKVPFKGGFETEVSLINKIFHEGMDRDNISFVIRTVAQFNFKKDDYIEDVEGKRYRVTVPKHKKEPTQSRYLKPSFLSKEWWLGVEGYE